MQPGFRTSSFRATGLFAFTAFVLMALRQDFWLRNNSSLIAGLPVGLAYHIGYCLLVSLVLAAFLYKRRL